MHEMGGSSIDGCQLTSRSLKVSFCPRAICMVFVLYCCLSGNARGCLGMIVSCTCTKYIPHCLSRGVGSGFLESTSSVSLIPLEQLGKTITAPRYVKRRQIKKLFLRVCSSPPLYKYSYGLMSCPFCTSSES